LQTEYRYVTGKCLRDVGRHALTEAVGDVMEQELGKWIEVLECRRLADLITGFQNIREGICLAVDGIGHTTDLLVSYY
jgi:hypothetical protein